MSFIFSLSRPGMCAGALPLHQLLHKLTRSGQHKAVAALRGLSAPLPPDVRVQLAQSAAALGSLADLKALAETLMQ